MADAAYPSIYCPLCKHDLDCIQTFHFLLEEGVQEDGHGTGELIRRHYMDIRSMTEAERSQEVTVHVYCWLIAERVFRKVCYDQAWIDELKGYLHYLSPFMTKAPFQQETDSLDFDVCSVLKPEYRRKEVRARFCLPLPTEIIQRIYRFLDDEEDIINLDDVLLIGPCLEQWRELGYKFMLADDLDPRMNVITLIQNTRRRPQGRYPKTANYRTIWRNIELIWRVMESPLVTENLARNAPVLHHVKHEDHHGCVRHAIMLPGTLYIVFMFKECQDLQTLCGMVFNGRLIGHEGPIWKPVYVTFLKGLKIASLGKHIVGIQIRDSFGWQPTWHGDCLHRSSYTTFEWASRSSELVASYDVSFPWTC